MIEDSMTGAIRLAEDHPGRRIAVIAPTHAAGRQALFASVAGRAGVKLVKGSGAERVEFANGSTIELARADAKWWRGRTFDHALALPGVSLDAETVAIMAPAVGMSARAFGEMLGVDRHQGFGSIDGGAMG